MGSAADRSPVAGGECYLLRSSCGQRSARAAPGDATRSAHAGPAAIEESCGARCHEPASASASASLIPSIMAATIRCPLLPITRLPTEDSLILAVSNTFCNRLTRYVPVLAPRSCDSAPDHASPWLVWRE